MLSQRSSRADDEKITEINALTLEVQELKRKALRTR
jgi:hypothetical protein